MKTLNEIKALVGALPAGGLPIALLPVGVQTRFVTRGGAPQLLVRVYPDEVHLDGHDLGLTAAEAEWGRRYWELIWPAARDTAALRRAWDALAERFGSQRAAWVARRTGPTNLAARPATPPAFPDVGALRSENDSPAVQARALPDRWIVVGYRAGERVLLEAGGPIPEALTVSPGSDGPPPEAGGLPLDPRMRWMVDFEEAERVGMGIRIGLTEFAPLDRLLVLGVKASLTAEAATARLETMLDAHHYARGLALLAPGTPTNNTAEAAAGFTKRDEGGFEVEAAPPRIGTGSDGAELARLLGIKLGVLTNVEGAARLEDMAARRLQTALWPVTGRYYLDQLLRGEQPFSDATLDSAKQFYVNFVRAQGPLGMLRIGRQPYGLVPAMSLDLLADQSRLVRTLRGLRSAWRSALAQVPRLQPDSADEERLVEILRMQPVSVGVRGRPVVDRGTFALGGALPAQLEQALGQHASLLRGRLRPLGELAQDERIFDALPAKESAPLTAAPAGDVKALRTASFDALLAEQPDTLLRALLRHSLLLAQATLAQRRLVPGETYREPALVDVLGQEQAVRIQTLLRVFDRDPALRATIHSAPELEELRSALQFLETVPQDALARHLAGVLDLFSYRLDAWITGLATRRLNELRRQTPRGLAIGGFGWVEDLKPEPQAPVRVLPPGEQAPLFAARERGGAIHAPSMPQASAAAVLRSGYLNEPSSAFAVDLRSERVRLAQFLLDGVRDGQPLSELLGYRFERALHERGLDEFLPGFRRVSRLPVLAAAQERLAVVTAMGGIGSPVLQAEAMQMIAAALVAARERFKAPATATAEDLAKIVSTSIADGLELASQFRAGRVPFTQLGGPVNPSERSLLTGELRALDQAVDALGDALTAEGVYQAVRGNTARAAASVDALAHGDIQPPELEVVQTPRTGAAVTHRLLAVFSATPAPAPLTGVRGARALAEPALELWLRQMLGDLRHVLYAAEYVDAAGAVVARKEKLPLGTLVAAPLDALYMSTTELLALLEHAAWKTAPAKAAAVRLLPDRSAAMAATVLSLTEFLELLRAFRDVVLGARALDANDVAVPGTRVAPAVDAAELRARADAAVATLRGARGALSAPDERLVDFLFLGFPDVLPAHADRVPATLAEADRRLATVDAMTIDRATAAPEEQVAFDQERLRTVFGPSFRALPLVRPGNLTELSNSLRRSDELQGGDPLQAHSWLQGAGRVRPGVSRLGNALSYAAALGRATDLKVAQLPFLAGDRWIGLPGPTPVAGKVSLVAHLPRPFQVSAPLSGLVLDEWVEVVPARDVTTGVAFNYDAPGARAPQAILLAVAPPGHARWEVETLEATLLETLELAKLRAVDPQALGGDVLLQRALPALYVPTNLGGEQISTDFRKLASA